MQYGLKKPEFDAESVEKIANCELQIAKKVINQK
jgi:hypothetical protein